MQQVRQLLAAHGAQYPRLQPQDAIKLLYQNEFGGGHIIPDAQASLRRLQQESAALTADDTAPLTEDIGNGLCRLHLRAALARGYALAAINRVFVAGAQIVTGDRASFAAKLAVLRQLTQAGAMPFTADELEAVLQPYEQAGCPMLSHSEPYRAAYAPAYRLVLRRHVQILDVCQLIETHLARQERLVVAIDGRCGSGKTTLAQAIAELYDAAIVHMDDFFLPPQLRTAQRLAEPGGNVHVERFAQEVLPALRSGGAWHHRVFDCAVMAYEPQPRHIPARPVTVVEGSYSLHPQLAGAYDLRIFTTCSPQTQQQRIRKRDGEAMLQRFIAEWIPMEERYFRAYAIEQTCDYIHHT